MIARGWTGQGFVALVATLLLVLQWALGSVAIGAEPVQRDIFGNVICTDGRAAPDPAHDGGGHSPDCCLLGCAASSHGPAGVPSDAAELEAPAALAAPRFPTTHDAYVFATQRRQGNPRAPPVAA